MELTGITVWQLPNRTSFEYAVAGPPCKEFSAVKERLFWLIEGRDLSCKVIYQKAYPLHYYSDQQVSILLQALTAKSALTFDEIAAALCRRGKRTALLKVQRLSGEHFTLGCGPSLDWTARVIPMGDRRLVGLV